MRFPSPGPLAAWQPALRGSRTRSTWVFLGNGLYSASQWLCLVVLVWLAGSEMTGRYAFALAVATPVLLVTNLSLSVLEGTDVAGEYSFAEYLGLRLLTSATGFLIVGAVAFLPIGGRQAEPVILLVGAIKAVDAVGDVFLGLFQQRSDMLAIAIALGVNGVVSALAFTAALVFAQSLSWAVAGSALGSIAAVAAYQVPHAASLLGARALRPAWNARRLLQLARRAVPVGFASLRVPLASSVPRYFLRARGESELGIFAALSALAMLAYPFLIPLTISGAPRLARKVAEHDGAGFSRLLGRLLCAALVLGAAGWLAAVVAGGPLIALVLRPEYSPFAGVLAWLMAAMAIALVLSVLEIGATALRALRIQGALQTVFLAVLVAACAVLVPRDGMRGAAVATTLASAVPLLGYVLSLPALRRSI